ncbi:NeuD/PglB/VioB family sugar acetyltransferase [Hydrogenophaga sp. OTU3427]|uniref:NeuD/PglB/VioB family sugar acetyltransferase n=1 Tax=Hydrogenophaga sp. OTU3427 TaxID=3043856 RepID=UPI00313E198B
MSRVTVGLDGRHAPAALAGLCVLGFGGHARSVLDVALSAGVKDFFFVDTNAAEGESLLGFPVLAAMPDSLPAGWAVFPAAGANERRAGQVDGALRAGWPLATLVSPLASLGVGATIESGCFIGHHAHIGPMARIGTGCIINTGALVEHEAVVGDFCHVSVNAVMAGRTRIGRAVMIGAGATVLDGLSVADGVTIGGGGLVHRSISEAGVYVGVPARPVAASRTP